MLWHNLYLLLNRTMAIICFILFDRLVPTLFSHLFDNRFTILLAILRIISIFYLPFYLLFCLLFFLLSVPYLARHFAYYDVTTHVSNFIVGYEQTRPRPVLQGSLH